MNTQAQRFALIDASSGFIWWAGDATTPEEACMLADKDTNQGGSRGLFRWIPLQSGRDGYLVYEAPADFDVNDGQDKGEIEAVESMHCLGLYVPYGE